MTEIKMLTLTVMVIAWIGVIVQFGLILARVHGLRVLREHGINGPSRFVSLTDAAVEVLMLVVFLLFLLIGGSVYISTFRGTPPYGTLETWVIAHIAFIFRWSFIAIEVLLLLKGIGKFFAWRRLLTMIGAKHERGGE